MCEGYKLIVNYYDKDGEIKADLFSDEAERVVRCFLAEYEKRKNKDTGKIEFKCKENNQWKENCPVKNRKVKSKLTYTQIRKFYDEVLRLKSDYEKNNNFRRVLPYFRMLKAKANVAFERGNINKNFKTFIEKNVDYVGDNKERFKIFCTFFEAVVAYSKGTFKD